MVKEPLYLPGDKQELFDRYLDKTAHADLIERLRVITGALQNKLTPQKLRLHRIDRTDAITLFHERQKLTKKMFQAVVTDFAVRVCTNQIEICAQQFYEAPRGKEAEHIAASRIPDLCDDTELLEQMYEWWKNLLPGQKKGIAKTFDDDFNPEWCFRDKEEETIQCIDACWRSLPLETRIDIYHYCV